MRAISHLRPRISFACGRSRDFQQCASRPLLQRLVGALALALARRRMCKLSNHSGEDVGLPSRRNRRGQRLLMIEYVDELHFAVFANADTGLRSFDPAATDALPRVDAPGHRCPPTSPELACADLRTCDCSKVSAARTPRALTRIKILEAYQGCRLHHEPVSRFARHRTCLLAPLACCLAAAAARHPRTPAHSHRAGRDGRRHLGAPARG